MRPMKSAQPKNAPHRLIFALSVVMLSAACGASTGPAPSPGPTTNPCTGVVCSGHGSCSVQNNAAVCTCDSGYRADGLSCKPSCDQCGTRVCGGDNGCGQTCGTCPSSSTCSTAGQCVASPPPPPPPPPSNASLKVVNNSATTIWYLYVSPASSGSWGPDQLGGNIISPSRSFTINGIPCPNYYDLKVENSSRTAGATRYNVLFTCGVTNTWTLN